MANFNVSLGIKDQDGHVSNASFNLVAADMTAAQARAVALMPLVDTIIKGRIESCIIGQVVATGAYTKAVPEAGADIEVKGRFLFDSVGGFSTRVSLPTFDKDAHTVVGGNINTADLDVDAFIDEIVVQGWSDYRFADITALKAAYEAFGR